MNEQLQAELAKLVGMLNDGAEKVAEFGAEQIPIVLQQLLLWHSLESFFFFVLGLIGLFLTCKYTVKAFAKPPEGESNFMWDSYGGLGAASVMVSLGAFISGFIFLVMACENLDWLKIWLAPNLYLLEYAAGLVK